LTSWRRRRYPAGVRDLVEALCDDRCAGRAPGTPGGLAARGIVVDAIRGTGLTPEVQPIPGTGGGANVLAAVPGDVDRFVLVAAHYDHLGLKFQESARQRWKMGR
jgi:hypothetical protein